MKKNKRQRFFSWLILFSMILSMFCSYCKYDVIDAQAMTKAVSTFFSKANSSNKISNLSDNDEYNRIIVSLESKSVADTMKINNYTSLLKKKENKILKKQGSLIKKVEKITGKKVKNQCSYLVNAFSIDATAAQMAKITKLDGVKSVFKAPIFKTQMANAVKSGNALKQYESKEYGYTGEGTIIAIIDSGVNYKHQDMVLDSNVKTKFSKSEWSKKIKLLGYGKYCSNKVPFGYDYTSGKNDCLSKEEFHGYHVSGIAAANGDITGIAKNAQLLGLRVLDDSGSGSFDDILCAIEDAIKLGADVINMSLGREGGTVSSDDFLQNAIDNATENGVIVSVAMGNYGTSAGLEDNTNLLGLTDTSNNSTPAIAKNAITVGAASNPTYKSSGTMKATIENEETSFSYVDLMGYGFNIENTQLIDTGLGLNDNNELSISASSIKDKIAVVKRGKYTFNSKLYKLSLAEPKGIILVDTESTINGNIRPYDWYGVPVIMVNSIDGEKIIQAAKQKLKFTYIDNIIGKENVSELSMASFSQWGPGNDLTLKPEIVAPGVDVKSTLDSTDNYAVYSGTSMATPYITGAEAIMLNAVKARKLNISKANLSKFLKNSLMNTADPIMDSSVNQPYSVRYQGSGMVDLYGAVNNNVLATCNGEAKVELGSFTNSKYFTITLKNYGSKNATYNLKSAQVYTDYTKNSPLEENDSMYYITPVKNAKIIFNTNKITVPARKSVTIKAKVILPKDYPTNSFVEAYIKLIGNNVENIGLPVLGFNGNWDNETIIDSSVYDNKKSALDNSNNYSSAKSYTGFISYDSGEYGDLLGTYWVKTNNFDKNTVSEDNNSNNNISNIDITTFNDLKDTSNAIRVNVNDKIQVPLIDSGDEKLYKISTNKDVQCRVKNTDMDYCVYTIYDNNGHFITSNQYFIGYSPYLDLRFSMKAYSSYYISFASYRGDVGIFDFSFEELEYDEDYDLSTITPSNKYIPLSLNKTTTIKNNNSYGYDLLFKPATTGFYEFDIKGNSVIKLYTYDYLYNLDNIITDYMDVYFDYKSINRTYKMQAGRTYILSLISERSLDTNSIFATVNIKKSTGDNAYVLEPKYNGSYNAFSPNDDDINDEAVPGITILRNAKTINVNVLTKNKKIVRRLSTSKDVAKQDYLDLSNVTTGLTLTDNSGDLPFIFWDGTLYSKAAGKYVPAKDGQYYIQIVAKITDNSKEQTIILPIKIDRIAPKLTKFDISKDGTDTIVTFKATDNYNMSSFFTVNVEQVNNKYETESNKFNHLYIETTQNENGEYVYNLGDISDSKINFEFKDAAGNSIKSDDIIGSKYNDYLEYEEKNNNVDMDKDDEEDSTSSEESDDVTPPALTIVENSNMNSLFNIDSDNTSFMLLNKGIKTFEFEVKVNDDNFNETGLNIEEGATVSYIGNQTYKIKVTRPTSYTSLYIDLTDNVGNQDLYYIAIFPYSRIEDYEYMVKDAQFAIEFTNIDLSSTEPLEKSDLNPDGTLTLQGLAYYMPDKLEINNKTVKVDPTTLEFVHYIKIKKGCTKLSYTITKNGEEKTYSQNLYYDKVTITQLG